MRVLIRVDASVNIGSGHLMRCLTLAERLREIDAEVAFVCRDLPGALFDFLATKNFRFEKICNNIFSEISESVDCQFTISAAKKLFPDGFDWVIVDNYSLGSEWECQLKLYASKLLAIDDLANRKHYCDVLLDQNFYQDFESRYRLLVPKSCVTLLGPSYALLRNEFVEARKNLRDRVGMVKRLLVFLGGSDPSNETQKILEAFNLFHIDNLNVDVVVGAGNPNRKKIEAECRKSSYLSFHCQISNMAELMASADLAIGAGGSSMWERCYLGLPSITIVFAKNQERSTADVAKVGVIEYLGWANKLCASDYALSITKLIDNPERVKQMSELSLGIVNKSNLSIADLMKSLIG